MYFDRLKELAKIHGHDGKQEFITLEDARKEAKKIRKKTKSRLKLYKCRFGDH